MEGAFPPTLTRDLSRRQNMCVSWSSTWSARLGWKAM